MSEKINIDGVEYIRAEEITRDNLSDLLELEDFLRMRATFSNVVPNLLMCRNPYFFDPKRFNWDLYSWFVARYCPEHLDPEKYNWEKDGWAVPMYCPEHLDPERFNWRKHSKYVCLDLMHLRQIIN